MAETIYRWENPSMGDHSHDDHGHDHAPGHDHEHAEEDPDFARGQDHDKH